MLDVLVFCGFFAWCAAILMFAARRWVVLSQGGPWRDHVSMASGMDEGGGAPPSPPRAGGGGPPSSLPPELLIRAWLLRPGSLRLLRKWVMRLLVPRQDSRDVAQDVAVAALRSAHTYNPAVARPERWMNGIAVHTVAHWRDRARHRHEVVTDPEEDERRLDETPTAEEQIGAEERRLDVLDSIQRLHPADRSLLIAHDIDGIPMSEIAAQLRIPLSTAYKWRARALAALAELLRADE
jgi:RNA polymerase sigma factor (sigma-70 family)